MAYGRLLARIAGMALVCHLSACGNAITIRSLAVRPDADLAPVPPGAASLQAGTAVPSIDLKAMQGSTIDITLRQAWRTKALPTKTTADVTSYYIALVANLPGDGGLNLAGIPNYTAGAGNGMNDYSATAEVANYTMPVSDPNLQMRFINVPNGTYRIRVKALDGTTANISQPNANVGPTNGGRYAVSTNSVTLQYGSLPTYNNGAPNVGSGNRLEANVQLQNGTGDNVTSNFTIIAGNAIPSISGSHF